jgi:ABC-type histidine transport system ATPase subunit
VPVLYRDCVVLICVDAEALAEALAGLPARAVLWQVSDTAVALDPELADEVVNLLRRAGLTPRVVAS